MKRALDEPPLRRALILAAGLGTRLRPLTNDRPKAMVPFLGVPILHRLLRQLGALGVSEAAVIVGHEAEALIAATGATHSGVRVSYFHAASFETTGTATSLAVGGAFLTSACAVIEGDLVCDDEVLRDVLAAEGPTDTAGVALLSPPMSGTVVELREDGRVMRFLRNVSAPDSRQLYKTVNLYRFSAATLQQEILPRVARTTAQSAGRRAFLEDVLSELTGEGRLELAAIDCSGRRWAEVDTLQELRDAEDLFSSQRLSAE